MAAIPPWAIASGVQVGSQLLSGLLGRRDLKKYNEQQEKAQNRANLINALSKGRFNYRAPQKAFTPSFGTQLAQDVGTGAQLVSQGLQLKSSMADAALRQEAATETLKTQARARAEEAGKRLASEHIAQIQTIAANDPLAGGADSPNANLLMQAYDKLPELNPEHFPDDLTPETLPVFQSTYDSMISASQNQAIQNATSETDFRDTAARTSARLTSDRARRTQADTLAEETTLLNQQIARQGLDFDRQAAELSRQESETDRILTLHTQQGITNMAAEVVNGQTTIGQLPTNVQGDVLARVATTNPEAMPEALRRNMSGLQFEGFKNDSLLLTQLAEIDEMVEQAIKLDQASSITDRDVFAPGWSPYEMFGRQSGGTAAELRASLVAKVESIKATLAKAQGNSGVLSDPDIARMAKQLPDVGVTFNIAEQRTLSSQALNSVRSGYENAYLQMRSEGIKVPTSGFPALDAQMENRWQELQEELDMATGQGVSVTDPRVDPGLSQRDRQRSLGFLGTQTEDSAGIISGLGTGRRRSQDIGGGSGAISDTDLRLDPESTLNNLYNAIITKESSNNYTAINPDTNAIGLGQLLPSNIPDWSRQILGREITPEQFAADPKIQETIIRGKLEQFYTEELQNANGDPAEALKRVAARWYSGRGHLFNDTRPQGDGRYPSIADYSNSILDSVMGR